MSIFQDLEKIRDNIGHEKYDAIDNYLKTVCSQNSVDNFLQEMDTIWDLSPDKWNCAVEQLKAKHKIILLDDVLYIPSEWAKYNKWYNEQYLHRKVEINEVWENEIIGCGCRAKLYENNEEKANVIVNFDEATIHNLIGDIDESSMNKVFEKLIYYDFDKYLELPKISECSNLLQEIYDGVSSSEISFYRISNEDWKNCYSNYYSKNDIDILNSEIKKYGLSRIIEVDTNNNKIIGYGDLETMFNDDRHITKDIDCGI